MARPRIKQRKQPSQSYGQRESLLRLPQSYDAEDTGQGRIANALSKLIAYERTPSLFDEQEIADRDNELRALQKLKEADIALCVERKNKPVVLTSIQNRIIHALSFAISQEIETSEDVKKKIENPQSGGNPVRRVLNVTALTKLLFSSTRTRYKHQIINEIYRLSKIRQVQPLNINGRAKRLTAPLIMLGNTIEDVSPEEQNSLDFETDFLEIFFGSAFFYEITNRFAVITPKLFEVWGKKGRGTELFSVLLSSIFSVYWSHRQAAIKAEERVRRENKKLPKTELKDMIAEARRNAMTYELNVSSIKNRVRTDYDSQRSYKQRFKKDLEAAIEGFKELGLIVKGYPTKGAKGQEKVVFILSEEYNFSEKQIEAPSTTLLEDKSNDNEPSAF